MPSSRLLTLLIFGIVSSLGVASCSQGTQERESGSLALQLTIADDVEIDEVAWVIRRVGMEPMEGTISTSAPGATASIEVFGLPPSVGKDYTITMEAIATDGETACKGSEDFGIDVGEVTEIEVMLNCKRPERLGSVRVNGEFNICPELVKMVVSPLRTSMGNDIDLFSAAEDLEGDDIYYSWTGTGGSFDDPDAASTTYTCDDVGDHFVKVTVTDEPDSEHCMSDWTVEVACGCPSKGDLTTPAEILPHLLPDADTLWEWQTFMVETRTATSGQRAPRKMARLSRGEAREPWTRRNAGASECRRVVRSPRLVADIDRQWHGDECSPRFVLSIFWADA